MGFWTATDRQQQQGLRVDTQPSEQVFPQRQTERTHQQIESASHARVQGPHALVQEIEQTADCLPQDVQGALLIPLADLHFQWPRVRCFFFFTSTDAVWAWCPGHR